MADGRHLKIDISPYLSEKSPDFDEILYTAADFELDERHVVKNEKVALDRIRLRQNLRLVSLTFLFVSCGGLSWLHVSFLLHVKYSVSYRIVTLDRLRAVFFSNLLTGNVLSSYLGNEWIHVMTNDRRQRLRVDLTDWYGNTRFAEFDNFGIASEHKQFQLNRMGHMTGTAGWYRIKVSK